MTFRLAGLIAANLLFVALAACHNATTPAAQYRKLTIAEFKKSVDSVVKAGDTSVKNYQLEGYYVNEKVPMLVSNLDLMRKNALLPDSAYILLTGEGVDSISRQEQSKRVRRDSARTGRQFATSYEGAYVSTKIDLRVTQQRLVHLIVHERPVILRKAEQLFSYLDKQISLLAQRLHESKPANPAGSAGPTGDADKYALLYSGGYDSINAHLRYWNDLEFMYNTLTGKYGFPPDHIVVIYADGHGEDPNMPVGYPATALGFKAALAELQGQLTTNSTFFTFFTNHGGGYDTLAGVSVGGRPDANNDEEPQDSKKWDEELYYYQQTPNDLWDDSLTAWFAGLPYGKMIILAESCFGGGLVHDLRGPNRMVFAAANQYEYSYGDYSANNIDFDTFSYYFTCALNGATYDGTPVNADTNNDGKVSLLEAFLYAQSNDKETEHPLMDDSGDGIGTPTPTPNTAHGRLAAKTWLR
jgi:Peptidase C13 family